MAENIAGVPNVYPIYFEEDDTMSHATREECDFGGLVINNFIMGNFSSCVSCGGEGGNRYHQQFKSLSDRVFLEHRGGPISYIFSDNPQIFLDVRCFTQNRDNILN
ncbi:hypothetical protein J6590_047860 [Homalodisca vitripennis]|nr:hypothetical protein J6590_047860 [Homalodisca vitripennis]